MKKVSLLKGLALGVMLSLTTGLFADSGKGTESNAKVAVVPYLKTDFSVLSVANSSSKSAYITIKDKKGDILYKEWVSKGGLLQKILDFRNLEDGEYKVSLKVVGLKEIKETFIVKDEKIFVKGKDDAISANTKSTVNIAENLLCIAN